MVGKWEVKSGKAWGQVRAGVKGWGSVVLWALASGLGSVDDWEWE